MRTQGIRANAQPIMTRLWKIEVGCPEHGCPKHENWDMEISRGTILMTSVMPGCRS